MKRVRFGIVGCGAIVTLHQLPALKRCPQVDLVAVTDLDGAWASKVAQRSGVSQSFDDYRSLVGVVDAALVATPNTTHADIASVLLGAGVHVLCEKPMATSRADADRIFAAAERGRARVMAGHCLRFSPNLAVLRRVIKEGWLGTVERISAAIGAPYDAGAQRTDFRRQKRLAGGGALMDLGVHVLDLALWYLGQPADVLEFRSAAVEGWEVESDAEVALRAGSADVLVAASFTQFLENTFTVRGSEGWARASLYAPTQLDVFARGARICRRAGLQQLVLPDASMYDRQIAHFCDALATGGRFLVEPDEVRRTMDVIDACYLREAAA